MKKKKIQQKKTHPRYDLTQIFAGRFKVALPTIVREAPHFSNGNPRKVLTIQRNFKTF